MSRDLDPEIIAAAEQGGKQPVMFAKLEFDSGTVYLHTGIGIISFDGNDYSGIGVLGKIGIIREDSELSRSPLKLTLSGITESGIIAIAGNERYQGRPATIYLGYFDEDLGQLVGDTANIVYEGLMNYMRSNINSIELVLEDEKVQWDTPRPRRYNDADQQERYPGDKIFQFVPQMVEKKIVWGKPDA